MLTRSTRSLICGLAAAIALGGAPPALAKHGDDDGGRGDVRTTGRCTKGSSSTLRLRSRDGAISVEFEISRRRRGESWRVVVVHERRVAWRGSARTGGSGSFRVRRTVADLDGADLVTVHATGPGGIGCDATATLWE